MVGCTRGFTGTLYSALLRTEQKTPFHEQNVISTDGVYYEENWERSWRWIRNLSGPKPNLPCYYLLLKLHLLPYLYEMYQLCKTCTKAVLVFIKTQNQPSVGLPQSKLELGATAATQKIQESSNCLEFKHGKSWITFQMSFSSLQRQHSKSITWSGCLSPVLNEMQKLKKVSRNF